MGSFYIKCGLSGTTITDYDEIYAVLLRDKYISTKDEKFSYAQEGVVINDRKQFFGFPILGTYGDYGRIKVNDSGDHIDVLEDFFGLDISTILDYKSSPSDIGKNIDIKNRKIFDSVSMTFIHKEIYDSIISDVDSIEYVEGETWLRELTVQDFIDKIFEYKEIPQGDMKSYISAQVSKSNLERKPNHFHLLNLNYKNGDFLKKKLKEQIVFTNFITELDIPLGPLLYGNQDTNWLKKLELDKIVSKVISNKYIESREDDYPYIYTHIDSGSKRDDQLKYILEDRVYSTEEVDNFLKEMVEEGHIELKTSIIDILISRNNKS